jgi:hypothetical protein
MKLIHKQTGKVVREGDKVTDFRGEKGIVLGWTKPQSPASSGRITVTNKFLDEHHCYPEVYFCEWIDREDRLEEPQPTPVGGFKDFKPDWNTLEVFPSAPIKPIYGLPASESSVKTSDTTAIEHIALLQKRVKALEETVSELQRILK